MEAINTFVEAMQSAKNPMVMLGALSSQEVIEYVMRLSEALNAHIAATGNTVKSLREKGYKKCSKEYLWNVINYELQEEWKEGWKGVADKGRPDFMIFIGYNPFFLQKALSTLKYFLQCKTLTLDNRFFADANYSLIVMSPEKWKETLEEILEEIKRRKK